MAKMVLRVGLIRNVSLTSSANITGNTNFVQYRVGSTVLLTNGFRSNTNFHAYIRPCGNGQSSPGMYMKLANPEKVEKKEATQKKSEAVFVYPNPADQYLHIQNSTAEPIQYHVSDLTGCLILTGYTTGTIDLSTLSNGTYILQTNTNIHKICVIH